MEALGLVLSVAPKIVDVLARWLDPTADIEKLKADTQAVLGDLAALQTAVEKHIAERDAKTQAAIDALGKG
jgi:hypothetical protein